MEKEQWYLDKGISEVYQALEDALHNLSIAENKAKEFSDILNGNIKKLHQELHILLDDFREKGVFKQSFTIDKNESNEIWSNQATPEPDLYSQTNYKDQSTTTTSIQETPLAKKNDKVIVNYRLSPNHDFGPVKGRVIDNKEKDTLFVLIQPKDFPYGRLEVPTIIKVLKDDFIEVVKQ